MTNDKSSLIKLMVRVVPNIKPDSYISQINILDGREYKIIKLLLEFKDDYDVLNDIVERDLGTKTEILDTLELHLMVKEMVGTRDRHGLSTLP